MLKNMQTEFIAVLCGLVAGIGWGFSGFYDAKASKHIGPLNASLLINCFVAVGFAIIYLAFLSQGHTFDLAGMWYAIASGVVITIGALCYFKGLALGPVSLVSPLSAAYPLVTTLIAMVIFHAVPTAFQFGTICMIMFGVLAASGILNIKHIDRRKVEKGPLLGLVTALAWGLGYALASQAISRLGWQLGSVIEFTAMALAFGVFVPFLVPERRLPLRALKQGITNKYVLLSGSISLCAALALNIGLSRENSSGAIVATLSACYPVLTVLLARRSFNEKVALIPLVGAFVSIAGVILLSLSV